MSGDAGRMIVRGAQAAGAGFAVRIAARLLFLFMAARLFGPAAFGAYLVALAVFELAVTLAGLGTRKTIFHLLDGADPALGRPPVHRLLDAALAVAGAALVAAALLALLALFVTAPLVGPAAASALLLLAPLAVAQALVDLLLAATRWTHRVRHEVLARSLVEPWAGITGTAAAWLLGWRGAEGLVAGYGCATLATLLYAAAAARAAFGGLRLSRWRPDRRALAELRRLSPGNSLTDFLNAFYTRADLYLVGAILGEAPSGLYGTARQLVTPVRQVRQSFDGLFIPLVARTLRVEGPVDAQRALVSASRLILVVLLPLLLLFVTAGEQLLSLLGPGFAPASFALAIFAVAEVGQAVLGVGDLVFVYLRPRLGFYLALAGTACGIVAGLLLIPFFGIAGAAMSVLIAYATRAALRRAVLSRELGITLTGGHLAPVALACAAGIAGFAAGTVQPFVIGPLVALGLYGGGIAWWLKNDPTALALTGFVVETTANRERRPTT